METVEKTSKGTAYNPEGPAGVEGQTSPVYSDMSNLYTLTEEKGQKVNNVINTEQISEENAEQILNALMQDEKDIQEKQKKMML